MLQSLYKGVPPPPRKIENKALPESRQAAARFSRLVNLVFSPQTAFFECEHPFIDKPTIITEVTVPSARLFRSLGSKLYLSNKQRMLNKDLAKKWLRWGEGGRERGWVGLFAENNNETVTAWGVTIHIPCDSIRFRLLPFDFDYFAMDCDCVGSERWSIDYKIFLLKIVYFISIFFYIQFH